MAASSKTANFSFCNLFILRMRFGCLARYIWETWREYSFKHSGVRLHTPYGLFFFSQSPQILHCLRSTTFGFFGLILFLILWMALMQSRVLLHIPYFESILSDPPHTEHLYGFGPVGLSR